MVSVDCEATLNISKSQRDVIDKMQNGWELGYSMGFRGRYWIQRGGCGCGGDSQTVKSSTVHALVNRGLIAVNKSKFPLETYKLIPQK